MKKIVNLSDIDGTLVNGSLVLEFFGYLQPKNKIFKQWKKDKKNEKLICLCSAEFQNSLKNYEKIFIDNKAIEFIDNYKDFNIKSLSIINESKNKTYLISGSPNFLVKPLANKLSKFTKIKFVAFGSIYQVRDNRYNGKITTPMYCREEKLKKINKLKEKNKIDYGFGDTSSDEFVLKFAKKRFLVQPNQDTILFFNKKRYKNISIIN